MRWLTRWDLLLSKHFLSSQPCRRIRKTGFTLVQHPIAVNLQNSHSAEDVTTLLQGLALAVSDFRERDRMMKAIKTAVTLLTPLSDSTSLTEAVDPVRQKVFMMCLTSLTFSRHHSHLRRQCRLGSCKLRMAGPVHGIRIEISQCFTQLAEKVVICARCRRREGTRYVKTPIVWWRPPLDGHR